MTKRDIAFWIALIGGMTFILLDITLLGYWLLGLGTGMPLGRMLSWGERFS